MRNRVTVGFSFECRLEIHIDNDRIQMSFHVALVQESLLSAWFLCRSITNNIHWNA